MSDAEMAQLIAALEESERTAREEAEARKAMHVSSAGSQWESPTRIHSQWELRRTMLQRDYGN